ncbi:hypothetical protein [Variovorax sp. YR266]|uniref:hypothetical protein n=1 Tax=Variovorax sp. YR266 TaxID=1884386 RepID=UPI000B824595|nr:hypothetical protein [Variovorax sp. YR266]
MNWTSLEVWSDIVGFASAILLLIPAWHSDWISGLVDDLEHAGQADKNARAIANDIAKDAARWRRIDRRLLQLAVLLLLASFTLKLLHHQLQNRVPQTTSKAAAAGCPCPGDGVRSRALGRHCSRGQVIA